jgi:hypothetical protein
MTRRRSRLLLWRQLRQHVGIVSDIGLRDLGVDTLAFDFALACPAKTLEPAAIMQVG